MNRLRPFVVFFAALIASFVYQSAAVLAACPGPELPVCAEFFDNYVFVGKVLSSQYREGEDVNRWQYDLAVTKMFRGPRVPTLRVYTEETGGSLMLDVGQQYLLFAAQTPVGLEIDACGNSGKLSETQPALDQIEQINRASLDHQGGKIEGRVVQFVAHDDPDGGVEGVQLTEKNSKIIRAVSDSQGRFSMHAPAGRYSVQASSEKWSISGYDLSYDHANDFMVYDGGCAELIFLASPK
jgi:hypothetical protein